MSENNNFDKNLIAWYPFDDAGDAGKDASGNNQNAEAKGTRKPQIEDVCGRKAAVFKGGEFGASYFELPKEVLKGAGDNAGITVSAWICCDKAVNVWERIFDFGKGQTGPYMFLTRFMRGVCFNGADLFADAGKACPVDEWVHIAMTVTGTKGGSLSSAGPRIYLNGELAADGFISQTSSGTYKQLREWFATLEDMSNYGNNFIGHSQFDADVDFCGAISDFRIYKDALTEEDIISLMCEALTEEEILKLAKEKFLPTPAKIITDDIELPDSLMEGSVSVKWSCDKPSVISEKGKVKATDKPEGVIISAELQCKEAMAGKSFQATVMPKEIAPYEITVHGDDEVLDISKTLYGLFYEDINNAADGGIYAEMIQNRSFEDFVYEVYDARSGENGKSAGRKHNPLRFWFGDLELVQPKNEGGLNEHFGLEDPDANAYYVEVKNGAKIYNRGFCDNTLTHSMNLKSGVGYNFTIWAKADKASEIKVTLLDEAGNAVSNEVTVKVAGDGTWNKYAADKLVAAKSLLGQIELAFTGEADGVTAIDMVSLMPDDVWGAEEEAASKTAHKNFESNSNYRLRKDLVDTLVDLHPKFLRFPGGCISEGSYIWDNVYDWKDSVGDVAVRKENFNVWGYVMTLGLGYMEYFQLAEDLNTEPLPVMACGVLCQARSDYANPAGGKLQEKYINNFIDLIDFAISTDFDNNKWAALRKEMGHEAPFGLHYLGVGNENWGTEFFASFEKFMAAIDAHMEKNYPGYELHIISTAGAQADDDAYQQGWKFLAGKMKGGDKVSFTDGENSFEEEVTWYENKKHYLDTIVDEHYYRSNDYLLENADRYNYYYRAYKDGVIDDSRSSKVFIGEYASSDKNTLAGAVAEAAVMTGFEKNSDVVRLAATAPLFNKVVGDGTYRWTPDAIWFDNEKVWRTPNYYVQQLFAKYIGEKLLSTDYETYKDGIKTQAKPCGGVSVAYTGDVELKTLKVISNIDGNVMFEQNFAEDLADEVKVFEGGRTVYYINNPEWEKYTVELTAKKNSDDAEIYVGVGMSGFGNSAFSMDKINLHEYCVGYGNHGTGLKVYKDGKEGYTMGDYSSSVFTGNLRACYDEKVEAGEYQVTVNYGGSDGKSITCYYGNDHEQKQGLLECKLESYNRDVYHSVTKDAEHTYMKLINADDFDKKVKVNFSNLSVDAKAELVVLTGDKELVHALNVNTKEEEKIVPAYSTLDVAGEGFELTLPANSVNVVVLNNK